MCVWIFHWCQTHFRWTIRTTCGVSDFEADSFFSVLSQGMYLCCGRIIWQTKKTGSAFRNVKIVVGTKLLRKKHALSDILLTSYCAINVCVTTSELDKFRLNFRSLSTDSDVPDAACFDADLTFHCTRRPFSSFSLSLQTGETSRERRTAFCEADLLTFTTIKNHEVQHENSSFTINFAKYISRRCAAMELWHTL